jgi:hypothetical protein
MAGVWVRQEVKLSKKVDRLRRGSGTFIRVAPKVAREAINKNVPALEKELEIYAPERPGQTYQRTFAMRRGWKVKPKVSKNTFSLETTNRVDHTHFVVGQPDLRFTAGGKGQAWMHKGRWWIAGEVIRRHYQNIERDYELGTIAAFEDQTGFTVKKRSGLL